MIDKQSTMSEALSLISDGDIVGLGGMTIYRRPVAFIKNLIKSADPPQGLTLLAFTAGVAADMLVGAGLVKKVRTCYFGFEIFGFAPNFTTWANRGELEIIEESEASLAYGIRAKLAGVSFMPALAWQGTDMFNIRPDVRSIDDPISGQTITAFPAIDCDVAIIHVLTADKRGNCILGGNPTIDGELSIIAKRVIITAEEVVDEIDSTVDIIGLDVDCVVPLPNGAWPTSCYPLYPIDGKEILRYISYSTQDRLLDYLDEENSPIVESI